MVVQAIEIAPAAYASKGTSHVEKEDDLSYDLGNLLACDTHPFQFQNEKELTKFTRENFQLLMNQIFQLPSEESDLGPLALLPLPTTVIPREKRVPEAKKETRWEAFAKEKGIMKKKKTRMVYDEDKEAFAPRWGYKRANDDTNDWAMEYKTGQDIYSDPWTDKAQEKKERVQKNLRQEVKNKEHMTGTKKIPSGIPVELLDQKKGKEGTKATLKKTQFSTASMGKFDDKRQGEPERKKEGKRHQRAPVVGHETSERERSMNVVDRLLGKEEGAGKRKESGTTDYADEDENPKAKKRGKKLKNITKGQAKNMKNRR